MRPVAITDVMRTPFDLCPRSHTRHMEGTGEQLGTEKRLACRSPHGRLQARGQTMGTR